MRRPFVLEAKKLLTTSRLFVEESKLNRQQAQGSQKRSRFARDVIKIGQGGTLDPLADGVLGNSVVVQFRRKSIINPD